MLRSYILTISQAGWLIKNLIKHLQLFISKFLPKIYISCLISKIYVHTLANTYLFDSQLVSENWSTKRRHEWKGLLIWLRTCKMESDILVRKGGMGMDTHNEKDNKRVGWLDKKCIVWKRSTHSLFRKYL